MTRTDEPPLVAVLDYGIGNLRSAQKGLERAGADARLTSDKALVRDASGVVLPGVGHFGTCMANLKLSGLDEVVRETISCGQPFLGICVGMQMMFESSEEAPNVPGLGILPGVVRKLPPGLTRPLMQWNRLDVKKPRCRLLNGIAEGTWMYFVHSYAADTDETLVAATCEYGTSVTALIELDNIWATQFHPEKSGLDGQKVTRNFVDLLSGRKS